jgi:serine/threonine protein kinase
LFDQSNTSRPSAAPLTVVRSVGRWIWPASLAVLIGMTGMLCVDAIQQSVRKNLDSKLTTILETDIKALTIWTEEQKRSAYSLAQHPELRSAIGELIEGDDLVSNQPPADVSHALVAVDQFFYEASETFGYVAYHVTDREGQILADSHRGSINAHLNDQWQPYLDKLARGETVFIKPSRQFLARDADGTASVSVRPLLFVAAPIRNTAGEVIATVAFGIPPEREFTEILSVARAGATGETFAFDEDGWLLSDSRFDSQLQRLGLLENVPDASAVLNVRSQNSRGALTAIVASAVKAKRQVDGRVLVNLSGTTDYRGVKVVGATQWLPQYDFGVVTKLDYDEAYAPGLLLRNIVAALLSLSLVGAAANVWYVRRLERTRKRALRAERKVWQLGQYTLLEKIGEGGMGEVYRAKHAMLRRPTAVKLLRTDRSGETAIARFEQEVQLTAVLTHPNTIAIYDYGRTPDGTFFYAMEYLDGLDLSRVVKLNGPQPAGRVIAILHQVCNSLSEAHEAGLVHRDIKPANVILLRRGSRADIVKVLDFGLVRDLSAVNNNVHDKSRSGTPAYMSPESLWSPGDIDARSDLYAVGALGYYLLTGTEAVQIENNEHHAKHFANVHTLPSPSQRLGRTVPPELSAVLMSCLKKNPDERPQSAAHLAALLAACESESPWSRQQSLEWWETFDCSPRDEQRNNQTALPLLAETQEFLSPDVLLK